MRSILVHHLEEQTSSSASRDLYMLFWAPLEIHSLVISQSVHLSKKNQRDICCLRYPEVHQLLYFFISDGSYIQSNMFCIWGLYSNMCQTPKLPRCTRHLNFWGSFSEMHVCLPGRSEPCQISMVSSVQCTGMLSLDQFSNQNPVNLMMAWRQQVATAWTGQEKYTAVS